MKYIPAILLLSMSSYAFNIGYRVGTSEHCKIMSATSYISINEVIGFSADVGAITPDDFLDNHFSFYVQGGPEFKVELEHFYMKANQGIAYLGTDKIYGIRNHFQYPTTVSMGVQNNIGVIGVFFRHISSGKTEEGISFVNDNSGANIFGIEMFIKLGGHHEL